MKESGPRGFVDIPGKHIMEITFTVLLLPACPDFTCSTLPRAGMCSARHTAQPTPASCIAQQSESQTHQHSEGKAGRGGICWSSPLPRWCITWRGEHVTPQSHAQVLPCTVSHLQTGFSLASRGCSHFPSQVCKQTGLVPARASVTCPACSPPSLGS